MSFKSIVVCLDNSRHMAKRMEYALEMAQLWNAHLVGIYLSQYFAPYVSYDGVAILMAEFEEQAKAAKERVFQQCHAMARVSNVPFEWLAFDSRDVDFAMAHMRTSDLIIASQQDIDEEEAFVMEGFPENFLLGVGRPMMILPLHYTKPLNLGTVLVAWNASRECARAIADALPILCKAKKVSVVVVEQKDFHYTADVPEVDVNAYFSRHNVNVTVIKASSQSGRAGIGQSLLATANECGAGLIVMGAYGHSRLTEWVLGGVTQTLLKEMTVPVLMSH